MLASICINLHGCRYVSIASYVSRDILNMDKHIGMHLYIQIPSKSLKALPQTLGSDILTSLINQ